ncbi:MAG: hypothetical protein LZF62_40004 [Nitrospira sp.]|nr:MAG: hypothetical protein LZF62_40004 [Nitrospira sp.]
MPVGHCRLCDTEGNLQLSHVVPAFLFRWVRKTSGDGFLRMGTAINQRVQDGSKRHWLCAACEGLLSRYETAFAEKLFYPYVNNTLHISYEDWLLPFCVSLSWRVLRFHKEETDIKQHYSSESWQRVEEADAVWKNFLLGKAVHPGRFYQFLIPLGSIGSVSIPHLDLSPNLNRYLLRTIDIDIGHSPNVSFVYCKLPRFAILGCIHNERPNDCQGTKVRLKRGRIEPQKYKVPFVFIEFMNRKARREMELTSGISARQREKTDKGFLANADKFVGSDAFIAMQTDIDMFGEDAFGQLQTESGPDSKA